MIRPEDSNSGNILPFKPKSLLHHFEPSGRVVSPEEADKSMDLFFDAMDGVTMAQELTLLTQALKFDPRNPGALSFMIKHLRGLSADEEIALRRKIVVIAADQLGEEALNQMHGHFWGFHETRPYMRVRAELAEALFTVGRIGEAITEWEAMLVLNPGDNQGLRYRLLASLMALGKIPDAKRLFKQYPDEPGFSTVFSWLMVLELHLAGKETEALKALNAAEKQNKHSKAFILGTKGLPKQQPDTYAAGSKEEAACFADDLQMAWAAHPAARKWLATVSSTK
ncbi:MAG: bacterial transcriptional activator domain-containing protein [Luteolibacter sp.]